MVLPGIIGDVIPYVFKHITIWIWTDHSILQISSSSDLSSTALSLWQEALLYWNKNEWFTSPNMLVMDDSKLDFNTSIYFWWFMFLLTRQSWPNPWILVQPHTIMETLVLVCKDIEFWENSSPGDLQHLTCYHLSSNQIWSHHNTQYGTIDPELSNSGSG